MYSIGIAAMLLGVCTKTLRRWDKTKKINCTRTRGGHRRFSIVEIRRILNNSKTNEGKSKKEKIKTCALYCRVSSHKQQKRGDLARQIDLLKAYAKRNHLKVTRIYKDVGSGLNANRKRLWQMIKECRTDKFSTILISFKDRLTRFGYRYLEEYVSEFGVRIVPIKHLEESSPESELVEDLIAIIHSFSGKMYRMRRKEKKQENPSHN